MHTILPVDETPPGISPDKEILISNRQWGDTTLLSVPTLLVLHTTAEPPIFLSSSFWFLLMKTLQIIINVANPASFTYYNCNDDSPTCQIVVSLILIWFSNDPAAAVPLPIGVPPPPPPPLSPALSAASARCLRSFACFLCILHCLWRERSHGRTPSEAIETIWMTIIIIILFVAC